MKYISASDTKNSEYSGAEFLRLNNCGAFLGVQRPVVTKRPGGRADYQLIYIQSGALLVLQKAAARRFEAGTVLLFRPGEPQCYRTDAAGSSYYWLHFTGSAAQTLLAAFQGLSFHTGAFPEAEDLCLECARAFAAAKPHYRLYCDGKLLSFLALLAQKLTFAADTRAAAQIEPAILYIRTHSAVRRANAEYADMCGMSKAHFIRLFRTCTGMPPQQYRTARLIDEAKELLQSGGLAVQDISNFLGFDDPLYFSRLFKKHAGISPTEYAAQQSDINLAK